MTTLEFANQGLLIGGLVAEGLCTFCFLSRRKVRSLPLVFSYLAYLFVSDSALALIAHKTDVWPALVATTYLGYFVEAAAIWELSCRLLQNTGGGPTRMKRKLTALFCIFSALGACLLTNMKSYSDFGSVEQRFLHTDITVSIFRVLAFLGILAFLRLDIHGASALASRVTLIFAAYAIVCMLKHVLNELVPTLGLSTSIFQISECVCGFVWVFLLFVLIGQIVQRVPSDPTTMVFSKDQSHAAGSSKYVSN